jgi:CheY-like chemotaxis protein
MRILIIDGNPAILNMFKKLLEIKGFSVTAETTFDSGLQHLENKIYNLVFIDVPLNHYTEKQILTSLKKNNIFQKTNVVLFSSIDFNDIELDEWKKEGLYSYLKKPVKRSTIIKMLDDVRTKISSNNSQILPEPIVKLENEEDTTEHLKKLNQLQKQIQKLKLQSEQTSPSSTKGSLPKESAEKLIQELDPVPEPEQTSELEDEKNTTEHLKKLNQSQKQIQKLQNISHQHTFNQKNSQLEKSIGVAPEPVINISNLKNIINNLKSLHSTFESIEQPMKKPFVETDVQQDEIIKEELGQILFELSKLKNEIKLLDEIDDSELKYDHDSSYNNKKPKKTKKSGRNKIKKPIQIKYNKKSKN